MNLGGRLAPYIRDQAVFELKVIQADRFRGLLKEIDDRSAAQTEVIGEDCRLGVWKLAENKEKIQSVGSVRRLTSAASLREPFHVEEEKLLLEVEIFLQ